MNSSEARILFMPMTEGSGIGPTSQLLAIAETARLSGLRCAFVASEKHRSLIERAGLRTYAVPQPTRRSTFIDSTLDNVAKSLGITSEDYLRKAVSAEIEAIADFRPTHLVSACKLTAPISAHAADLALLSIGCGSDLPTFHSPLYPAEGAANTNDVVGLNTVRALYNLEPITSVAEHSFLQSTRVIAPTTPELDPLLAGAGIDVEYVGALHSCMVDLYGGTSLQGLTSDKTVLAYLNAGSLSSADWSHLLRQLSQLRPDVMFLVINSGVPAYGDFSDNVKIYERLPIFSTLSSCGAFITGGGYNALQASIIQGVPFVGVPAMSAERLYALTCAQNLGCGEVAYSMSEVPQLLDQVLGADRSRVLRQVGRNLTDLGGPRAVVASIIQ